MSHPLGAGAGSSGAHPLNDNEHRRRGGWWIWLAALFLAVLLALLVALLIHHFSGNDTTTAARRSLATTSASPPQSTPVSSAAATTTSAAAAPASTATGPLLAAASCSKPTLTVTPKRVRPGRDVVIVGRHFSGCHASTGTVTPTVHLPVTIGVVGVSKVDKALGKARTSAGGYFRVALTAPAGSGTGRIVTLAAASRDTKTTLAYSGRATLGYSSHAAGSVRTPGGGTPTGVPAGSGGLAASTARATYDGQLGLLAVGLLLAAGGATTLVRRRHVTR